VVFGEEFFKKIKEKLPDLIGVFVALVLIVGFAFLVFGASFFQESFDEKNQSWLVGPDEKGNATWQFTNKRYQTLVTRAESVTTSRIPLDGDFEDYCLKIDVYQLPMAKGGEVGVAFDSSSSSGEFNTFGVYINGNYRLGKYTGQKIKNLPVTTRSYKLGNQGRQVSELMVIKKDGNVKFYGDGKLLATVAEESTSIGKPFALFGRSGREPFIQGTFDNLEILEPSECP